jgi:hypothetical protein
VLIVPEVACYWDKIVCSLAVNLQVCSFSHKLKLDSLYDLETSKLSLKNEHDCKN